MFTSPFPNAFGLNINDLSIKIVQLKNISRHRHFPSFYPAICRAVTLPHGLIVNGEIQEPEVVRKYIQRLLAGGGKKQRPINSHWVVASLPETKSFIKRLSIAKQPEEIIGDEIILMAKKHIPFDEDSYYIDWQKIPTNDGQDGACDVLVGAVSKTIANSYTYLLKSLGLGVVALEIEALSIARAMITAPKVYENEARALLDLGATRSGLVVYDHDSIEFSASIPFSGELITTALSQKLNISYEEAEKKKISLGLDSAKHKGKSFEIVSGMAEKLANEVNKAIQFYYTHFPNTNKITHITMCGGTANWQNLDKILSLKLKIQTAPGKPWKNLMSKKSIPIEPELSLTYAVAIGLALRAADNPFFQHNII